MRSRHRRAERLALIREEPHRPAQPLTADAYAHLPVFNDFARCGKDVESFTRMPKVLRTGTMTGLSARIGRRVRAVAKWRGTVRRLSVVELSKATAELTLRSQADERWATKMDVA